jgi:hypothetical protein
MRKVELERPSNAFVVTRLGSLMVCYAVHELFASVIAQLAGQIDRAQQYNTGTTEMIAHPSPRNQENGIDGESAASKATARDTTLQKHPYTQLLCL